jgi:hypothetical protein
LETQTQVPSEIESPSVDEEAMPEVDVEESMENPEDEPGGITFEEHRAGTPAGPINLVASASDKGILVEWGIAPAAEVAHTYGDTPLYSKVFRRTGDTLEYTQIGTTVETFFLDEDVETGQVYYYTVVQVHPLPDTGEIDSERPDEVWATAP